MRVFVAVDRYHDSGPLERTSWMMVRESTGLAPEYSDTLRPSKTVHMGFDGAAYRNFVRLRSDLTVVHTGLPFRSPVFHNHNNRDVL